MHFVFMYRHAIDDITADKTLKLRRYELDNDDWIIIEVLVSILKVIISLVCMYYICYILNL